MLILWSFTRILRLSNHSTSYILYSLFSTLPVFILWVLINFSVSYVLSLSEVIPNLLATIPVVNSNSSFSNLFLSTIFYPHILSMIIHKANYSYLHAAIRQKTKFLIYVNPIYKFRLNVYYRFGYERGITIWLLKITNQQKQTLG